MASAVWLLKLLQHLGHMAGVFSRGRGAESRWKQGHPDGSSQLPPGMGIPGSRVVGASSPSGTPSVSLSVTGSPTAGEERLGSRQVHGTSPRGEWHELPTSPHPSCLNDTADGWQLLPQRDSTYTSLGSTRAWSQGDGAVGTPHSSPHPPGTHLAQGSNTSAAPWGVWHARHLFPLHLADDLWLDGEPACPGQRQKHPLPHYWDSTTSSPMPVAPASPPTLRLSPAPAQLQLQPPPFLCLQPSFTLPSSPRLPSCTQDAPARPQTCARGGLTWT